MGQVSRFWKERSFGIQNVVEASPLTQALCLALGLTALVGIVTYSPTVLMVAQSATKAGMSLAEVKTLLRENPLVIDYEALDQPEDIDDGSATFHGPWKGSTQLGTATSLITHEPVLAVRILRGIRTSAGIIPVPAALTRALNQGRARIGFKEEVIFQSQSGKGQDFNYLVDASSGKGTLKATPATPQSLFSTKMASTFRDQTTQDVIAKEIQQRAIEGKRTLFGGSHRMARQDPVAGPSEFKKMVDLGNGMYQETVVSSAAPDQPQESWN